MRPGGHFLGALDDLDSKIRRLRIIETQFKQQIREAEEAMRTDLDHRRRHEITIAKANKKMGKVMHKVRVLFEKRERVRAKLKSR